MIYSVFNWTTGRYDCYEGPGEEPGIRPKARQVLDRPKGRGQPMEALLPVLPVAAIRTGSSPQALGRVAVLPKDAVGAVEDNPLVSRPWLTLGLFVGTFYVGMKVVHWLADVAARRVR